ncbi:response regulator [Novosphingobium cyanobacteriorum]|uniref:Response regulator n=1 Tax=Novosphingobium cyanobacteriorum TaxID=3024215 RepID=A0ABT6CMV6_9SPHN|nr:response regulator [Novosphingobium cyanobacteriorum]MDF8334849.1 response regulator [Novosphingobium cyanobacteriorum]
MIAGKTILVVEDEFIVAAMLCDVIEDEGAQVLGPAGSLAEALELAAVEGIDAAVLDWNLGGEPGEPVARALANRGVPFIIATGYGSVEGDFAGVPVLSKPYAPGRLLETLSALF